MRKLVRSTLVGLLTLVLIAGLGWGAGALLFIYPWFVWVLFGLLLLTVCDLIGLLILYQLRKNYTPVINDLDEP